MKRLLLVVLLSSAFLYGSGQTGGPVMADTLNVPVIKEQQFYNFKLESKLRLDSISGTVPLPYNEFVQQYIDIYTARKVEMGRMMGLTSYYFPIFEKALKAYNIPEEIKYLPIIESSMDPGAVSKHGATGLWQFMFATAKGYGLNIDNFEDQRKDPIQASYAAAAYFRDAYEELGDWLLALAAYNCGKGNVTRAMDKAGSRDFWVIRPFLPKETRNYVPAFIAAVYTMKYAQQHEIVLKPHNLVQETDTVLVNRFVSLSELAGAMRVDASLIFSLNPSYKKMVANGTPELTKRIVLPKAQSADYAAIYEILNNSDLAIDRAILAETDPKQKRNKVISKPVEKQAQTIHKVKSGENLTTIADKYSITIQELKAWNKLDNNKLITGQELKITGKNIKSTTPLTKQPVRSFVTYKVKRGDTLSEIAERFDGATVSNIKKDNNLNKAKLQEGMLLKIFKG